MLFLVAVLCFALSCGYVYSAEEDMEDTTLWESDSDIEEAFQDGDIDYDTYSNLLTIYDDKIDINTADIFQLQSLPGLSQLDATRIVNYRLAHKQYKTTLELINPEIIDEATYDKIKIFIVAELPGKVKTKGDILFKTKANTEVELDTTEYPRTYELLRFRVLKFGNYLKFGALVEGDARHENYKISGGDVVGGNIEKAYRLNKSYIGYENGPVITQAYVGNFRAGFGQRLTFDSSGKSSPLGFYPDDSYSSQSQFTSYITDNKTMRDKYTLAYTGSYLNGFGARIKHNKFDFSGFYSKAKYPLKVDFIMPNGSAKSGYLEDRYEETLVGTHLTYKAFDRKGDFDDTYIGSTLYTSKREDLSGVGIDIWRWPPTRSFAVYGTNFVTGYKGFNFVGEVAKVHDWGNAWYMKMVKKMGKIDLTYSHRDYDIDFYNPWANGYSKHSDKTKFRNRDEQGDYVGVVSKLSKTMKLQFSLDQFKHIAKSKYDSTTGLYYTVYETPTVDREIFLKYNWRLPRGVDLQLDRKWKDLDLYENSDSSEKMTVTTNCQIKFKPSKVSDMTLKYQYGEDYFDTPEKYLPKEYMLARASYDITSTLEISGEIKFADSDLRKSGGESRNYWLQVSDTLSRFTKLKLRYSNKYKSSAEEYESVDYYSYSEPGYSNKWELRVDYKW